MQKIERPASRRILPFLVRTLISATLLFVLFTKISGMDFSAYASRITASAVGALAAMFALQSIVASYRWSIVARRLGIPLGFLQAIRYGFEGAFFGQALPSVLGGDAVRVVRAGAMRGTYRKAFISVAVDRLTGLTALLALSISFVALVDASLQPYRPAMPWVIATGIVLVFGVFALHKARHFALFEYFARSARFLSAVATDIRQAFSLRAFVFVMLLSFVVAVLSVVQIHSIGVTFGANLRFTDCLALVPPCLLAQAVPISIAGWGVREGAIVFALGLVNVPADQALAISVAYGLGILAASLPGGVIFLLSGPMAVNHQPD